MAQSRRYEEAVALLVYCETGDAREGFFADCASARREVIEPPGIAHAIEGTASALLKDFAFTIRSCTYQAVLTLGVTGIMCVGFFLVFAYYAERRYDKWALRRDLKRQRDLYSDLSLTNQRHTICLHPYGDKEL